MLMEKEEKSISRNAVLSTLEELLSSNDAVYGALLSSIDGHPFASKARDEMAESKLSAMTSSCLALSEKIAVEAKQNGCDFVIIQNTNGYLVIKRVGKKLVLTALADQSINLGMLLSAAKCAAEALYRKIT